MLSWPITILIAVFITAILGFGGSAGIAVGIAKILLLVSMVLLMVASLIGRNTPLR